MHPVSCTMKRLLLSLLLTCAALPGISNAAPPGLLDNVENLKLYLQKESVPGIVEIRGAGGTPQPMAWSFVIYDARSPTQLAEYNVTGGVVSPVGPNKQFYPRQEPAGYFDLSKVEVDSVGAFRIAERAAGLAKVGFDSVDYKVRARELGEDPIWVLTLRSRRGEPLGIVTLSARSGKLLRTVWNRLDSRGELIVEDSATPGAEPLPQPMSETRVPPPPPAPEPEPAEPADPAAPPASSLRPIAPPPVPNVLPE